MQLKANPQKFRIILVEDDHDLRQGLAEYLELRDFEVAQAASGAEFAIALAENRYDLAILDVNLPDVSGLDLARFVHLRGDMGIIMLTALQGRDHRIKGFEQGADLYFTKPVDSEELALAAANLASRFRQHSSLSPEEPGKAETTTVDWKLDRTTQTLVAPDGTTVFLSAREAMLIEFLAARPGILVPRVDLLQIYSDDGLDPTSRRFDMAFARLKAKAENAGVRLPVQAVRGLGLRLIEEVTIALGCRSPVAPRNGTRSFP